MSFPLLLKFKSEYLSKEKVQGTPVIQRQFDCRANFMDLHYRVRFATSLMAYIQLLCSLMSTLCLVTSAWNSQCCQTLCCPTHTTWSCWPTIQPILTQEALPRQPFLWTGTPVLHSLSTPTAVLLLLSLPLLEHSSSMQQPLMLMGYVNSHSLKVGK